MKKNIIYILFFNLVFGFTPSSIASEKPIIENYTLSPSEVELQSGKTKVEIEAIISHPFGIENSSIDAILTNSRFDTLITKLYRIDNPINSSLNKVIFRGILNVPSTVQTGAYNIDFSIIKNNPSAGYQYPNSNLIPRKIRHLYGGEYGLLVRSGGFLNLELDTFIGPTFDTRLDVVYADNSKYNYGKTPIWKVGEFFNPLDYYELKASNLELKINSKTPSICNSDGKILKLISEGNCRFEVFTPNTFDYRSKIDEQVVTVSAARIKPILVIEDIPDQNSIGLPKSIEIFRVFTPSVGFVLPQSETPSVCVPFGSTIRILSGGLCNLSYQAHETDSYLASDLYRVSFEVIRDPQIIQFTLPSTATISSGTINLVASVSSGAAVTYVSNSTKICSVSGSTLKLMQNGNCTVTATQAGTSTFAPVSATASVFLTGADESNQKTITCIKGKSTKRVSGVNAKCPKGFKVRM